MTTLAIDIGGTFTDAALALPDRRVTAKVLTTPAAPEQGFLACAREALGRARLPAGEVGLLIHGTTLATNAIIERKGARVGLLCTEGFRDSLEMAYEHRFEQSDLFMERPPPLVPRHLRLPVRERVATDGTVLVPLDEQSVEAWLPTLSEAGLEALAIGFLHSYANPLHERRAAEIVARHRPDLALSLSSEVAPEIREYERLSTATANAYVQPLVSGYLRRLQDALAGAGFRCPLLLMMSSGGMTTLETAARFPIRLVESGPAGGAILAQHVAAECGLPAVLSFDMGGTTAKICFVDDYQPQVSRLCEVARHYRFLKGSGLPLRIPVIDMVEIGAGGGSVASVDDLRRIQVGPESAGASPGPACYGLGGTRPTVTDADLVLGRIDPARFAAGRIPLDPAQAERALATHVGRPLGLAAEPAAAGVSEIVDENMANAARVHGVESGKEVTRRVLVAFGGAAPLHACRVADKLGLGRIVIPAGAGVGSAIGFLRADIAYEVVRTRYMDLREFDAGAVNALFAAMRAETEAVVRLGAASAPLVERRSVFMRYRGQGHEVSVPLPVRIFEPADAGILAEGFEREYRAIYGRVIPRLSLEAVSWSLALGTGRPRPERAPEVAAGELASPIGRRAVLDQETGARADVPTYLREHLRPGARVMGPALIVEEETTTVVTTRFDAEVNALGYLVLTRKGEA